MLYYSLEFEEIPQLLRPSNGKCLHTVKAISISIKLQFQGFETRGTYLAKRHTAWRNLIEASHSSGPFVLNPKEWLYRENITRIKKLNKKKKSKQKSDILKNSTPNVRIICPIVV